MIGSIVMTAAPLLAAMLLLYGVTSRTGKPAVVEVQPASVSLSGRATGARLNHEPMVIFPGYLLPHDHNEEGSHAGG